MIDANPLPVQTPAPMPASKYQEIKEYMLQLYLEDSRPWLVGFSGRRKQEEVTAQMETFLPELYRHRRGFCDRRSEVFC
jgi:hypothetical protein